MTRMLIWEYIYALTLLGTILYHPRKVISEHLIVASLIYFVNQNLTHVLQWPYSQSRSQTLPESFNIMRKTLHSCFVTPLISIVIITSSLSSKPISAENSTDSLFLEFLNFRFLGLMTKTMLDERRLRREHDHWYRRGLYF